MRSEHEREQAGQVRNISTLTVYELEEERLIYTVGAEMERHHYLEYSLGIISVCKKSRDMCATLF